MSGDAPSGVEPEKDGDPSVSSLDRGLQLLGLIRDSGAVRVLEAAHMLGISPSTAHRLLQSLVARRFVAQDDQKRYIPGPAMTVPPMPDDRGRGYVQLASSQMNWITETLGVSSNLMMRVGREVRFLRSVAAEGGTGDRAGEVLAARACSGGRVILAALDDQEVVRIHRDGGRPLGDDALRELLLVLRRVRQAGYDVNRQPRENLFAVAVGLEGEGIPRGRLALTLSLPSAHVEPRFEDTLIKHVLEARRRIAQRARLRG